MNLWKEVLNYLGNERGLVDVFGRRPSGIGRGEWEWMRGISTRQREQQQQARVSAVPEATAAMQVTQRRAAEDRARALAEIRMGQQRAQQAMQLQQQQAITAMQPWQQQIQALQAAPEAIGAREEAGIYAAGRLPIEAQAQTLARRQQYQYAPGGFRQSMMRQTQQATIGQLGELRRRTALERVLRRRQDLMGLMGQQQAAAGMAGGIYGRTGAGLADIFGTGARSLAQIYGQTIAAVPQYQGYGTTPFQSPYPYQQG